MSGKRPRHVVTRPRQRGTETEARPDAVLLAGPTEAEYLARLSPPERELLRKAGVWTAEPRLKNERKDAA